jgi:hypothetical protein
MTKRARKAKPTPRGTPKRQRARCDIHIESWLGTRTDVRLRPNAVYRLTLTYPLAREAIFEIPTGRRGLDFGQLVTSIAKAYAELYAQEDRDLAAGGEGRWGIYGHDLRDLHIEEIHLNHEARTIRLFVGS